MSQLGDWEDELGGDAADDGGMPSLEWSELASGPTLPGLDEMNILDESPLPEDLRVTDYGASPWGPSSSEAYQPWAQAQTDSPPMGDPDDEIDPAHNAHPDVDPATIYDRNSYEPRDRQTYGSGIFDLPDQGAVFNQNDGIFANDYALPAYMAREPEMDVYETEALDVNTGLPRVAQVNASGVQLMREDPGRAWSPFAPPPYDASTPVRTQPYTQQTLHNFGSAIEQFGRKGAKAILANAAERCSDEQTRGEYICHMLDALSPNLSPRALRAVAQLRSAGYPGNAVELVVAHCLMYVAEADLADKARHRDSSDRLPRLDKLGPAGGMSPAIARAAQEHLGPASREVGVAMEGFRRSKAGKTTHAMLGDAAADAAASPPSPAPTPASGGGQILKYGVIGAVAITGGYFAWEWWKKQQQQKQKKNGRRAAKNAAA
jgi:hypothetical protein